MLTEVIRKKEETVGLSEDEIRFGIGALGDFSVFWEALPAASGPRIVKCIETSTDAQLVESGVLATAAPDVGVGAEVASLIASRVLGVDASLLADALAHRASSSLVDLAVGRIEHSASWCTTNKLMPLIPALVPYLSPQHVTRLCGAATTNYEIYQAHTADAEFTRLFERVCKLPADRVQAPHHRPRRAPSTA